MVVKLPLCIVSTSKIHLQIETSDPGAFFVKAFMTTLSNTSDAIPMIGTDLYISYMYMAQLAFLQHMSVHKRTKSTLFFHYPVLNVP